MAKLFVIVGLLAYASVLVLAYKESEPNKIPYNGDDKDNEGTETGGGSSAGEKDPKTGETKSLGDGSKSDGSQSGGNSTKSDGSNTTGSKSGGSKGNKENQSGGSKDPSSKTNGKGTSGSKSEGTTGSKGTKSNGSHKTPGSKSGDSTESKGTKSNGSNKIPGSKSGDSTGSKGTKSNGPNKTPGSKSGGFKSNGSKSSGSEPGSKSSLKSIPEMRPRKNIKCSSNTVLKCWTCSGVANDVECHSTGHWEKCEGTKPTCFLSRTATGFMSRGCASAKTCSKKKPVDCIDIWGNAVTGQDCRTCGDANDCWYRCAQPDKRGKCSFKCKTCDGATDLRQCKKSKTCKMANPTCEMTTKTDMDGVTTYHYGCKERAACLNQPGTRFGCHKTGMGRVCTKCQDDNKPKCQFGPGGKEGDEKPARDLPVPEPRCNEAGKRLQCWSCKNAVDDEDCSNQKDADWEYCSEGEICYYSSKKAGKGKTIINRGCMARDACSFESCLSKKGKKAAVCGKCNIGCWYRCKPQEDELESTCGLKCLSCTNANETECRQQGVYEQCHMHDPVCEEIWTKDRLKNTVTFSSGCKQRRACQNQPSLRPECKVSNSKFVCSQCEEGTDDCSFERQKSESNSKGSGSNGTKGSKGTGSNGSKGSKGTGSNGSNGSTGTGSNGSKGPKGTGSNGSKGPKGTGSNGSNGSNGSKGTKETGSNGSKGTKRTGSNGSNGTKGTRSNGSNGSNGSKGPKATGSNDSKGTGTKSSKGNGSKGTKEGNGSQGKEGAGSKNKH